MTFIIWKLSRLAATGLCGAVHWLRADGTSCWLHNCRITLGDASTLQLMKWFFCTLQTNKNILFQCLINPFHYWHSVMWLSRWDIQRHNLGFLKPLSVQLLKFLFNSKIALRNKNTQSTNTISISHHLYIISSIKTISQISVKKIIQAQFILMDHEEEQTWTSTYFPG